MILADRRVKIVATIGPASRDPEMLRALIVSGVNVVRLNFSHGSHEDHLHVLQTVRKLSQELNAPVTVLQDLQGPKIRVGKFKDGSILLTKGQKVTITTKSVVGEEGLIPTDLLRMPEFCPPGQKILLDDGLLELKVDRTDDEHVYATVTYGGLLKDRKGMNIPGANLDVECMTKKDLIDLEFGLQNEVDYVALSFVRQGNDIRKLRELIDQKNPGTRIVAKIEMLEALDNLEDIVHLSDAVMVARGDLAVEVGQSLLAGIQKEIIQLCNRLGRPVITATQMLDSMVENPRPTRAEVTDIANAVLDGSDALMLSAETASGKYPIKCIETMDEVVREVEKSGKLFYKMSLEHEFLSVAEAIAASSCLSALKLNATAIVCLTTSGKTARLISSLRPKARIIAVTHQFSTLNRMELIWGIQTLSIEPYDSTDAAMDKIEKMLLEYGLVKTGDKVILTMGMPVMERGTTNSLRVYTIRGEQIKRLKEADLPLRCRAFERD
jgi:pyruvate kinase